jgi:hypothetical protein
MYKCGPYGPNHATAATFAFRKELLKTTSFQEHACLAEEKHFLKNYTIPFVQLDPMKSILVFSHNHNSFDKKKLLQHPNEFMNISNKKPTDFIQETDILHFFMNDIDELLNNYDPGDPKHKHDVLEQIDKLTKQREDIFKKQVEYQETMNKLQSINNPNYAPEKINELYMVVQQLTVENNELKDKVTYLEKKITQLINLKIQQKKDVDNTPEKMI